MTADARREFFTDNAEYFKDKLDLYLCIKERISSEVSIELSSIKVCGSAYWGESFKDQGRKFIPGTSDLDVALISSKLYVQCLSEVRNVTKGLTDNRNFPSSSANNIFGDYAYKKGIIRLDCMPYTKTKMMLDKLSDRISKPYLEHFASISFQVYDCERSFAFKQNNAVIRFRDT